MKKFFFGLFLFSLSLVSGILIDKYILNNSTGSNQKEIRKSFDYKFINPLLECDSGIQNSKVLKNLKIKLEEIITQETTKKNISFVSVYFRDLNNGPWFGINEKEYFAPASLVKVPVLIAYLKKAEKDPTLLSQTITNPEKQKNGASIQTIKPSESLQINQNYTIEDLLNRMIIYSDNDAYNDLSQNISSGELLQVYQDLDVDISKITTNPNGNIITVKDYASFFRILYNSSYLNEEMSEKALSILSQTEYTNALVAGIPKSILVSHKFGERKFSDTNETQFHDCGIVYLPKKPYLICIMTRGSDMEKSVSTIKSISREVFDYINSK